ncbi:MAG: Peptidoglycan-binding protein [Nevskia sp.]|nr:Peptidoglycan-binding protein [Nevskia sp.]
MAKNIVVFSDGTGQKGGFGSNTNVYKLFNMLEDRTPAQIAFYDPGIGVHGVLAKATGIGMSKNICDCYRFIFDNFEAGDQLYLIGFSRGAATVRSLSGFIHLFGILPKSRVDLIEAAYKVYEIEDAAKRAAAATQLIGNNTTMWTRIQFLGCWDTVSALGVPDHKLDALIDKIPQFRHRFHDLKLSPTVVHARHALALDDQRKEFHPVLWDADIEPGQSLKQVWFCGMHADVGGGYPEQALSDIALGWLRDEAARAGLRIYAQNTVPVHPDPDGTLHDSIALWWEKLVYAREPRWWPPERSDVPVVHPSVVARAGAQPSAAHPPYRPWILQRPYTVES